MYTTYVICNPSGKIYIGQTVDLVTRLKRHNAELPTKKTSYTHKNAGPWKIVSEESFHTRTEAITREKQLKSFQGREYIKKLITNMRP
ncbi:MAG: GIY-YIG nuclease family protein [Candidatus Doudnabacteria bacterium]|nr:GIY-YIG nuclease family protein [Candidatus Doudnabacteria bacterium]